MNNGKANLFNLSSRMFVKSGKTRWDTIKTDDNRYVEKVMDRIGKAGGFENAEELKILTSIALKYLTPEEKKMLRHGDMVKLIDCEHNDGFYLWGCEKDKEPQLCALSVDYYDYGNISSHFPINKIADDIGSHYYYGLLHKNSDILWFDATGYTFTSMFSENNFTCYRASIHDDSSSSSSPWYIISNFSPEQIITKKKILCRSTADEKDDEDRYNNIIGDVSNTMLVANSKYNKNNKYSTNEKLETLTYDAAEKFMEKIKVMKIPEDKLLQVIVNDIW